MYIHVYYHCSTTTLLHYHHADYHHDHLRYDHYNYATTTAYVRRAAAGADADTGTATAQTRIADAFHERAAAGADVMRG